MPRTKFVPGDIVFTMTHAGFDVGFISQATQIEDLAGGLRELYHVVRPSAAMDYHHMPTKLSDKGYISTTDGELLFQSANLEAEMNHLEHPGFRWAEMRREEMRKEIEAKAIAAANKAIEDEQGAIAEVGGRLGG